MRAAVAAALLVALTGCTSDPPQAGPPPAPPQTSASSGATEPAVREPRWDPRDVDDLPAAPDGVAPLLPEVLEVPASSPSLTERPIEAAVLTAEKNDALHLLGVDGSWRRVPAPPPGQGATLTRDGTRLAVQRGDGVDVWDLPTGERTQVAAPRGHEPWDYTSWRWVDNDTLLLDDMEGGWLVSTVSGAADEVPYPSGMSFFWTVDSRGAVVESADWGNPDVLTDWAGGVRHEVDMSPTGRLSWIQADRNTVAGTSYENGPYSVYVADRFDLTPRDVLRVRDHDGNYSNGGLSVIGLLEDGTVLMRVAVFGPDDGLRIVAWDPPSGELSVVSTSDAEHPRVLSFAAGLLSSTPRARWNPRHVDDLPAAADDVASLLPAVLDAPASSPALAERPIDAAVLTLGGDDAVHLLSVDGSWRSVPPPAMGGSVVLSRDGTRLAVQTETGADIWDLAAGERTRLPAPPRHRGTEDVNWSWLDRDTLFIDDLGPGWRVDADTGAAQKVPYPRGPWVADDRGAVVETDWEHELTDWASGEPRRLDMSGTGRLQMFQASSDTIVGTASRSGRPLSVYVVDRSDLTPLHVLRVRDPDGSYGDGGLSVLALLDDGTVLLRLLVLDHSDASVRLVAWDPVPGELSLVTRTLGVLPDWSVAADLLG
jgi:hypothetical protein